jgi:hypothetical protein
MTDSVSIAYLWSGQAQSRIFFAIELARCTGTHPLRAASARGFIAVPREGGNRHWRGALLPIGLFRKSPANPSRLHHRLALTRTGRGDGEDGRESPPAEPELSFRLVRLCGIGTRTITSWRRPPACPATQQSARCRSRESCVPRLRSAAVGSAIPRGCRPHPALESCDFFHRQSWRPI